uniref:Uncharacterized protein n=1 Tax=Lotharella globosa TaxID=91324 RepID=A0A7S3YXJ2_9EUKA|eukprot:CAMPEP_0167786510 /NCGR_PEP_ID=MMETSP0111_2-20121227/8840_1 /TAXON_ID=91324 /ORGANISM="Lotharella globosa, Strain CCCM811" /LENGTH=312 /DNA_ID=CAMNT_0007677915 /DNA_START=12 /DNA_END=950 /DNA_ORIENTATION=-
MTTAMLAVAFLLPVSGYWREHHNEMGLEDLELKFLPSKQEVRLVHIPKSSGTALIRDARKLGKPVVNHETCAYDPQEYCKDCDEWQATMLREPRSHVLSMFFHCTYNQPNEELHPNSALKAENSDLPRFHSRNDTSLSEARKKELDFKAFDLWLEHFNSSWKLDDGYYGCYQPSNMQSRYLTCAESGWTHSHGVGSMEMLKPDLDAAKETLNNMFFFGIKEEYHTSLCLYAYQSTGDFPESCECGFKGKELKSSEALHGIPPHSTDDLNAKQIKQIDALTGVDVQLYQYATALFWERVAFAEARSGKKISKC